MQVSFKKINFTTPSSSEITDFSLGTNFSNHLLHLNPAHFIHSASMQPKTKWWNQTTTQIFSDYQFHSLKQYRKKDVTTSAFIATLLEMGKTLYFG